MSTKEEFLQAIELLISCRGSIRCCCELDDDLTDLLYSQCKRYINDYWKRNVRY